MADIGAPEQAHQDFKFIPPQDGHDHVIPAKEAIVPERSDISSVPEDKRNITPPVAHVPDATPQTPAQHWWDRVRKSGRFH